MEEGGISNFTFVITVFLAGQFFINAKIIKSVEKFNSSSGALNILNELSLKII